MMEKACFQLQNFILFKFKHIGRTIMRKAKFSVMKKYTAKQSTLTRKTMICDSVFIYESKLSIRDC